MAAGERREGRNEPSVDRFLGDPTRDLAEWRWLWDGDRRFPIRSHRGVLGGLIVGLKRLLRPFVSFPQADLWERQRIFNLVLLEYLQRGDEIRRVVLDSHEPRFAHLEAVWRDGLAEVMEHNDALFARADQKLDRVRRETREVWSRLGAALAAAGTGGAPAMAAAHAEHDYLEFEQRFRGTPQEIAERFQIYLDLLRGRGEILDLGCGRGEALRVLRAAGLVARGVDGSRAMVEACRRDGLAVEHGDLFATLERAAEGSLGAVVSFHVIEHLPAETLDRLVRLAWRALAPGGVLLLETPNPLSVVVAARNFWIDPTHRRPVHPETLAHLYRAAGFDPVERLDLHPFGAPERLPEVDVEELPESARALALEVNLLRDRLDDLLFGAQDYALVGSRPATA
jgi:SAM-dependent methyltransferase